MAASEEVTSPEIDDVFDDSDESGEVEASTPAVTPTETKPDETGEAETPDSEAKPPAETQGDEVEPESESDAVPPTAQKEEDSTARVPVAALQDERRKRQEIDRRAQELEQKVREYERKEAEASAPDPVDDPEGYAAWREQHDSSREFQLRYLYAKKAQAKLNEDYPAMESYFQGLVTDAQGNVIDQGLYNQLMAADDPAEFVYSTAKERQEIERFSNPEKRAQMMAEMEAELRQKLGLDAPSNDLPTSSTTPQLPNLAKATGAGNETIRRVVDDQSIDDVFDGQDPY